MTPAQRKFLKIVKDEHYFDKDSKILLALSGGKDSMTLFNWLYDLKEVLGIELGLAHINHGLREESKFEEIALREMATKLKVPIYVDKFTGEFTEKNARDFRYQFFEKLMIGENYNILLSGGNNCTARVKEKTERVYFRPLLILQLIYTLWVNIFKMVKGHFLKQL